MDRHRTEPHSQPAGSPLRNPNAPILYVDDDPVAHVLLRRYLQDWDLVSVHDAHGALDALKKRNFVIVITDIMMPDMDGLELLIQIKKKYGNRIQVIVVTVSEQVDFLLKALDGGACDFLLKPLDRRELQEVLEHTLARLNRWTRTMSALVRRGKEPS